VAEEAIDFRPLEVVFSVPGMDQVQRQRDLTYKSLPSGTLLMDIYHPPPPARQPLPAVVFVHGDGPADWLKDIKDWGQYVSWGRLVAASGLIGVTFNHRSTERWTRIADAAEDVDDLMATIRGRATEYGVDPSRLAVWVASAGGFLGARAAFDHRSSVRCLAVYYGLMEPVGGPELEKFSVKAVVNQDGAPVLVARAGLDRPQLNEALDRFTDAALKAGLELEVHNHARGHHAFDVLDPGPRSSEIIARTIEFLKTNLACVP